jgi:hypothetical protein
MDLGLHILSDVTYGFSCPVCNKLRNYDKKASFVKAKKNNAPCVSCSNSIKAGGRGNLYHDNSKICTTCGIIKQLSEFFSYESGYHHSCCKICSKSKSQKYHKNTYRFSKYGINKEQYNIMMLNQDGKCKICEKELHEEIHIDHNHTTGKVRGILCGKCNKGLGQFNDNIEFLTNAINYLKNE